MGKKTVDDFAVDTHVKLLRGHPHGDKTGRVVSVDYIGPLRKRMVKVELEDGSGACYAQPRHLKVI